MKVILSLLLTLSIGILNAQEVSKIKGQIVDESNQPIPFTSIYIEELKHGTVRSLHTF